MIMVLRFKKDGTIVISPENDTEAMALRYWVSEFQTHGMKMIEIETEHKDMDD